MSDNDATPLSSAPNTPPLPYTLRQLECFIAVASSGSIARAAVALNASDSAVSDAITALERALGAELFRRRRSRGATLTSDGITIVPIARRILVEGAELSASVGRELSAVVGPVRIGVIGTLASVILPRLIVAAQRAYPGIQIEYRTGDLASMLTATEGGELDLIITYDYGVPPEYERVRITTTHAVLVVAADHPLASRKRVRLAEIADEPMVMLDIVASRTHTLELMSSQGISPRITHRTSDYELCRALVGRGLGYSLLMRRNLSPVTWDGNRVAYLELDPSPRATEVLMVWPHNPIPPRVAAVLTCMKQLRAEFEASMG
ncbi:LysR family transcriptional regulator [Leucobacter luti]|uniref:LysR family transcriptional regulator n=1 Tax=Leucobacter luti TaxID=340320 RepID=UPI00104ADFC5|nr:LysR family transcriptional regulator [Leucobacter luti]MCW2288173.1 DNA-binding transcriptional LysR family regulator [Leucobacter luti]TCK45667.1 LysR family transcriptional regulator [Leucobacter luti]